MDILITESQLNELKGKYKDEIEILYKDKNLMCLIPKSQMTSTIYGKKTNWCQVGKTGFKIWSDTGLLIRFLFKSGKKIRLTYAFEGKKERNNQHDYHWSNETGYHVLDGDGNPFQPTLKKDRIRSVEKDIIDHINLIPENCKNVVLDFIKKHKDTYDYCKNDNDEEYVSPKSLKINEKIKQILQKYNEDIKIIRNDQNVYFHYYYSYRDDEFQITFAPNRTADTQRYNLKNITDFEKAIIHVINQYKNNGGH